MVGRDNIFETHVKPWSLSILGHEFVIVTSVLMESNSRSKVQEKFSGSNVIVQKRTPVRGYLGAWSTKFWKMEQGWANNKPVPKNGRGQHSNGMLSNYQV